MNQLQVIQHHGQRVLTTQQLAEAYGSDPAIISNNFNRNKERYKPGKHFICLEGFELREYKTIHQNDDSLLRINKLYLWLEKGAWLHAKSLNTDKAWESYEMLVDEYYRLSQQQPKTQLEILQASIHQMVEQERRLSAVETKVAEAERKQDNITEVLSLNPTDWRKKVNAIINKIAQDHGGYGAYQEVRNASYDRLEERARCDLSTRLTNKQRKMALEGVAKSKIDRVSKMDVIADDARLTEIYLAIVKEMAIQYQVDISNMDLKG
ncbi:ORF6N domain-containing protein [Paenibacillus chitinolyticus]